MLQKTCARKQWYHVVSACLLRSDHTNSMPFFFIFLLFSWNFRGRKHSSLNLAVIFIRILQLDTYYQSKSMQAEGRLHMHACTCTSSYLCGGNVVMKLVSDADMYVVFL